jgi:hypothetical protein
MYTLQHVLDAVRHSDTHWFIQRHTQTLKNEVDKK